MNLNMKRELKKAKSKAERDIKFNSLFYKKRAELQTLIKKREENLKEVEKTLKVKKRKQKEIILI